MPIHSETERPSTHIRLIRETARDLHVSREAFNVDLTSPIGQMFGGSVLRVEVTHSDGSTDTYVRAAT